MAKNMNEKPFDDATLLKLSIFGDCFEEWLPVFNNDRYTKEIFIFDFFAGSGTDINNLPGSPLVLLDKAKGKERKYCLKAQKQTNFIFNEFIESKKLELESNVYDYIEACKEKNNCSKCVYKIHFREYAFQDFFKHEGLKQVLNNKDFGKFILLDQYGFSQIDEDIFKQLISYPKTDFIFFISSSFIRRFREHPNTTKYIDTSKIDFDSLKPNEVHRGIANYFRDLIPANKEYYLHHFSIQKEANKGNYYGLIFGTNHTLGMEKFLKVCWQKDNFSGEASYNIDNNFGSGTLFGEQQFNVKLNVVKDLLMKNVLNGRITTNIEGFKETMKQGVEPKVFTELIKELESKKKIARVGNLNYLSTNIHNVEEYKIKVLSNGN